LSDADLYRQYAKEAMHGSSKVKDENEKQALIDLACTWAQAALMSERVLGASFISSPHDVVGLTFFETASVVAVAAPKIVKRLNS